MIFDVAAWRRRFPALGRVDRGRPVAWFDGPGGSQTPIEVSRAIAGVLDRGISNLGGAYPPSAEAEAIVHEARSAVADLVGAGAADWVAFGPSMTALNLALARAVSADWVPGDEVVVTRLDHDANISPWLLAAARTGASIRWVDVDVEDGCSLAPVAAVVGERTRLVALTHASNVVGTIPPVADAVAAARAVGAITVVDAVHHVPHAPTDMVSLDCDVLLCSAYKFHGPHVGAMAVHPRLQGLVPEHIRPAPDAHPGWWELGTLPFEALAGVTAAVDTIASLADVGVGSDRAARLGAAMGAIHAHTDGLTRRFLDGLSALDRVRLHGIDDNRSRTPTFALRVGDLHPAEVAASLADEGLYVGHGHFYGLEPIAALGLTGHGGVVRVGFVSSTTAEEVDRLLDALARL